MAQSFSQMLNNDTKYGPKYRYPWKRWLEKGTTHILKFGKDYTCKQESIIFHIRKTSWKLGRTVSIQVLDEHRIKLTTVRGTRNKK